MSFIDQINQNVGIFIYNGDFLFIRGIIDSLIANNTFGFIPVHTYGRKKPLKILMFQFLEKFSHFNVL